MRKLERLSLFSGTVLNMTGAFRRRVAQLVVVTMVAMSLGSTLGCTVDLRGWVTLSHEDSRGGDTVDQADLPPPENPVGDPVVLNDEEQARNGEADAYIAKVIYQGRTIENRCRGHRGRFTTTFGSRHRTFCRRIFRDCCQLNRLMV